MSICICSSCSSNCVPSPITAGEFKSWTWTLCDYPADEWELQLRFRGPSAGFDVDATADGTKFDLEWAFDDEMSAGKWVWQAWVGEIANPDNILMVQKGTMTVEAGFLEDDEEIVEVRSAAEIALATIDAALLAFSTSDVLEYEISTPAGTRRIKRSDKTQLFSLRKHWATVVSMERTRDRIRNGGSLMRSVPINVKECG
jgi:hypothetical protein